MKGTLNTSIPFNGNFYGKDGKIKNLDGNTVNGNGMQHSQLPFKADSVTFYDSTGKIRNIEDLSSGGGSQGSIDAFISGEIRDLNTNATIINPIKSLQSISGPYVTEIFEKAFKSCETLIKIDFPMVTEIFSDAFSECFNLSDISIPKIIRLHNSVFNSCELITGLIFLNDVKFIGNYAFGWCSEIKQVRFPNIKTIMGNAFEGCSSLEVVDIGGGSQTEYLQEAQISNGAFKDCSSLRTVILREMPYATKLDTLAGQYAFNGTPLLEANEGFFYVPQEIRHLYVNAPGWKEFPQSMFRTLENYPEIVGS